MGTRRFGNDEIHWEELAEESLVPKLHLGTKNSARQLNCLFSPHMGDAEVWRSAAASPAEPAVASRTDARKRRRHGRSGCRRQHPQLRRTMGAGCQQRSLER